MEALLARAAREDGNALPRDGAGLHGPGAGERRHYGLRAHQHVRTCVRAMETIRRWLLRARGVPCPVAG
eukprot:4395767-Pyramimonas_sp.AAC.1